MRCGHAQTGHAQGLLVGRKAAKAVLAMAARATDSAHAEPRSAIEFFTERRAGEVAAGSDQQSAPRAWARTGARSSHSSWNPRRNSACRPRPRLDSPEYAAAFNEVKRLGGDGRGHDATERTADQTAAGIYWAYDGTPSLCAPPRLYNQIIMNIADQMGTDVVELSSAPGAGQRGHVRCRNRDLGIQVLLPVLAADHGHPRGRSRHRSQPAWRRQRRDSGRSEFFAAGRSREQLALGRTSRRHFPRIRPVTPGSAGRYLRCCAASTGLTTFRSRSCRTSSTAKPWITREGCARCCRAASNLSHKPRRRTARAAYISASTGRLTKPPGSSRDVKWPPTYSSTRSADCRKLVTILWGLSLLSLTSDSVAGDGERGGAGRTGVGRHVERQIHRYRQSKTPER